MSRTPSPLESALFLFALKIPFCRVDNSVGHVRGVDSGIFALIGIESNCDIFLLVVFLPIGF